jgi:hypothetical protein
MPSFKIGDMSETEKMWYWDKYPDTERLCSLVEGEGIYMCPAGLTCGSPSHSSSLPKPMKLDYELIAPLMVTEDRSNDENIAYDLSNFNNLIWSMVTIFVMITLEGWTGLMYNLSDASMAWMSIAFCILLVVVGSFFLLNVILAVIMDSFDRVDKMHDAIEAQKKQ